MSVSGLGNILSLQSHNVPNDTNISIESSDVNRTVLSLNIFRDQEEIVNNFGKGRKCIFKYLKSEKNLLDVPLNIDFDGIEILIDGKKIKPEKEFVFNEARTNLLNFIKNGRTHLEFNCIDFANSMYGFSELNVFQINEFTAVVAHPKTMLPGAILLLYQKDMIMFNGAEINFGPDPIVHFAMYLGKKCFISLYGSKGPLRVSTIEDLISYYGNHPAILLYPKSVIDRTVEYINNKTGSTLN